MNVQIEYYPNLDSELEKRLDEIAQECGGERGDSGNLFSSATRDIEFVDFPSEDQVEQFREKVRSATQAFNKQVEIRAGA